MLWCSEHRYYEKENLLLTSAATSGIPLLPVLSALLHLRIVGMARRLRLPVWCRVMSGKVYSMLPYSCTLHCKPTVCKLMRCMEQQQPRRGFQERKYKMNFAAIKCCLNLKVECDLRGAAPADGAGPPANCNDKSLHHQTSVIGGKSSVLLLTLVASFVLVANRCCLRNRYSSSWREISHGRVLSSES